MAHDHAHGELDPELRDRGSSVDRAMRPVLLLIVAPLAVATLVGLLLLRPTRSIEVPPEIGPAAGTVRAEVARNRLEVCPPEQGGPDAVCQAVTLRLADGSTDRMVLGVLANPGIPVFEPGQKILVQSADFGGVSSFVFVDFQRDRPLLLLAVGFALLVVILARWKGLAALVGLAVTLFVLVRFVLPAIVQGRNPVAVCVVGASAVMFAVFFLTFGVNLRSVAALTGTVASLVITGVLAVWVVGAAHLNGGGTEESLTVKAFAGQVDLRGLLLGGIIIGSLGVLNDVTITQASAVWQLRLTDSSLGAGTLYTRAMQVGRDHIGATVDTLVLAYAGAALPLLVFFSLANRSVRTVLTSSIVAEEVVRSLVGAVGLVLSVPITTAVAAALAARAPTQVASGRPGLGERARARLSSRFGDPFRTS